MNVRLLLRPLDSEWNLFTDRIEVIQLNYILKSVFKI
jgi:hypothetical protein